MAALSDGCQQLSRKLWVAVFIKVFHEMIFTLARHSRMFLAGIQILPNPWTPARSMRGSRVGGIHSIGGIHLKSTGEHIQNEGPG
jgi:hypothetical protein